MTSTTLNASQEAAIAATIARMGGLSYGLGTEEMACSIAAINLALSGQLSDEIPECMSQVIGKWIITMQDAMTHDMRRADGAWARLLPLAAGTGRDHEAERQRLVIIMEWADSLMQDAEGHRADGRLHPMSHANASLAMKSSRRAAPGDAPIAAARAARAMASLATGLGWDRVAPADLLARLIAVTDKRALEVGA